MSRIWTVFGGFGQIQTSKMADQDDRYLEMITQISRHVTSQPHDADVKEDIFGHSIYPPSLVVIAFVLSELRKRGGGGAESAPPVVEDQKKPGLNRVIIRPFHN